MLRSVVNDDNNATKVLPGQMLYGINIRLADWEYTGDILHGGSARTMALVLKDAVLTGAIQNVYLTVGPGGKWFASGDSTVYLVDMDMMDGIDADIGCSSRERLCVAGQIRLALRRDVGYSGCVSG